MLDHPSDEGPRASPGEGRKQKSQRPRSKLQDRNILQAGHVHVGREDHRAHQKDRPRVNGLFDPLEERMGLDEQFRRGHRMFGAQKRKRVWPITISSPGSRRACSTTLENLRTYMPFSPPMSSTTHPLLRYGRPDGRAKRAGRPGSNRCRNHGRRVFAARRMSCIPAGTARGGLFQ